MNVTQEAFLERHAEDFTGARDGAVRFRRLVYRFWHRYGRTLPWRLTHDPYHILVSEIMLQQTQVDRVVEKYAPFLAAFPDVETLARAPFSRVLGLWKGLGYNRRALALKRTGELVVERYGGVLPAEVEELVTLPGVGRATASAICAYAFNKPVVFIETNIRTVYLHFFFCGRAGVTDGELHPVIERTLDRRRPRVWYSALMDLGVVVKKVFGNAGQRSAHHTVQTPFEGSRRQVRGKILKALLEGPAPGIAALARRAGVKPKRAQEVVVDLEREGLIARRGRRFVIP